MSKIEQKLKEHNKSIYELAKYVGVGWGVIKYAITKRDLSKEYNLLKKTAEFFECEIEEII